MCQGKLSLLNLMMTMMIIHTAKNILCVLCNSYYKNIHFNNGNSDVKSISLLINSTQEISKTILQFVFKTLLVVSQGLGSSQISGPKADQVHQCSSSLADPYQPLCIPQDNVEPLKTFFRHVHHWVWGLSSWLDSNHFMVQQLWGFELPVAIF